MVFSDQIDKIHAQFLEELTRASSVQDLAVLKVSYLGKKGKISSLMLELKEVSQEEKPIVGRQVNDLKKQIHTLLEEKHQIVAFQEMQKSFTEDMLDVTLPGRRRFLQTMHPIQQMLQRMLQVFISMGFSVEYGPELDTDYYNFEALNFTKNHPARDMQDTFYVDAQRLLRTHTSNVQVRIMESSDPPIRVVAPGRCFRNETISSRSHVFFHQVEGFYIDTQVSFVDLLSTIQEFYVKLLQKDIQVRCRPSYFPFVEPGMEVDIHCLSCKGEGCRICKYTGWLEVAGAGMIHPRVLEHGNIDSEKYSGYAWGMGVERLALLYYGIEDIRMLTENDQRFLEQFVDLSFA
jgi:phenylalanyl-tRNA synthetase alpha chain